VKSTIRTILAGMMALALMGSSKLGTANASDQKAKKATSNQVWDSGSFGIFHDGKRIGTEKFNIESRGESSVATSEIKVEDGNYKADQTAEMHVKPTGELESYSWRATSPQKEESSVEAKEQLLVEHVTPADQKKMDVPHVLPVSTVILDDYFFSQRELLVWRYLSTGCTRDGQNLTCGPSHFGILVPRQHTAGSAVMELLEPEKFTFKGQEKQVNKLKLDSDGVVWLLWVSQDYKVLKIAVPASKVEVVRD
jgi:hypothetical protein